MDKASHSLCLPSRRRNRRCCLRGKSSRHRSNRHRENRLTQREYAWITPQVVKERTSQSYQENTCYTHLTHTYFRGSYSNQAALKAKHLHRKESAIAARSKMRGPNLRGFIQKVTVPRVSVLKVSGKETLTQLCFLSRRRIGMKVLWDRQAKLWYSSLM